MKVMRAQLAVYTCLILHIREIKVAVPPSGLTSLRKCSKFYNFNTSEENFTPLTKKELDELTEGEQSYPPAFGYAGGQNAISKQLPFMAALGYDTDEGKQFLCGGTLISEEFVLTATHCIHSREWGTVRYVRLGDLNLTSSEDDVGAQEFQVKEFHIHPDYKYPLKYNDIALLQLDRPVVFTEYVSPACLEPKRVEIKYKVFHAAGWGRLGHGEGSSDHLQVGTLAHYPGYNCSQTFSQEFTLPEGIKHESQICAGAYAHLADTCEGDSGGPLAYQHFVQYTPVQKFVYMIAGITSFGKACAVAKIPAIYTRVSYYTNWIERTTWPNEFMELNPHRIIFPST